MADRILVATDDERILKAVRASGFEAVMTSPNHPSGSDRVAEVASNLSADIIVNLQGDEPTIDGSIIDRLIAELCESSADITTPVTSFSDAKEVESPNTAKVVVDENGYALYFSRSVIPFPRDGQIDPRNYLKHIGIYCYRRESLLKFVGYSPSKLEKIEKLEQLRALENGMRIRVVFTDYRSVPVDVPSDIHKAEKALKDKGLC